MRRPDGPARLAVGWLTMFMIGTDLFVISPLLPAIAADYRVSAAAAGLGVSVFSFAYMGGAPLAGYMAVRIGRRRVLVGSLLAFAAANLMTATAAGLTSMLVARAAAGAAAAGVSPSVYALVGGAAPPERRASWMALVVSGLLLSLAIGAPLGAIAAAAIGWAPVFVALAGASLALAWPNYRIWPPDRTGDAEAGEPPALAAAMLAKRLAPMVLWSAALYGMYTYVGAGLAAAGFSAAAVARAILCYGGGALAGVLIGGRLADRIGAKPAATIGLTGLGGCLLLVRAAIDAGIAVPLALGLTSAAAQLFFPAQQAGLAADFASRRASVLAWNNSALFLGIMLGSLLGGQAIAGAGFRADLTLCAVLALAGAALNVIIVPDRPPLAQKAAGRPV